VDDALTGRQSLRAFSHNHFVLFVTIADHDGS